MCIDGKAKGSAYAMEGARSANGRGSAAGGGATKFLADLPSRGLFSSTVLFSNHGGMRVYVCDHDNLPPDEQVIKTNQTNILIRSLTIEKQKNESSPKDLKINGSALNTNGKRSAGRCPDGRTSVKRANLDGGTSASPQDGSCSRSSTHFECFTVARLRILLKEKGLPTKGKKDELVARLMLDE